MKSTHLLTPDLLPSATELVAAAFYDNPAHIYLCPDLSTRLTRLQWILGTNLRIQSISKNSFCYCTGARVDAMGFWTRSGGPQPGLLDLIREGFAAAPFRLGLAGSRRLLEVSNAIDGAVERSVGDEVYWYLHNLVVRDTLRGTGIGGGLLKEQLDVIARRQPDALIVLATQREANVRFYGRFGFEIVTEERVGRGAYAFTNWTMHARAL